MMDATCSLSEVAVLGIFERGNCCELLRVLIELHWPERFVHSICSMSAMLVKSVLPEHGVPGLDQAWKAVDMALLTNIVQEETGKEIAL